MTWLDGTDLKYRERVRLIRAADRVVLGAYRYRRFIVDLSSIYCRFIVAFPAPRIVDISTMCRRVLSSMKHLISLYVSLSTWLEGAVP